MGKVSIETPSITAGDNALRGLRVALTRDPDLVGLPGQLQSNVQPDGTFCLPIVGPGDYRMYVPPLLNTFQWGTTNLPQPLQNSYVKSIRFGSADVLTEGIHLSVAPREQIEVIIGNGAKLDGTVVNEKKEPVVNATVALVPTTMRRRIDLYRSTTTDTRGRYKLQGVPPGSYRVFAWEDVERDAWQDPDFLKVIESRGATIQVSEGGQMTEDLLVIPSTR